MTENDFRLAHSQLIEYYQLIEMRLKFICAGLLADDQRGWFDRLFDYETDAMWSLLQKIKELQKEKNVELLSKNDFSELDDIRKTRNYWVHQCFGGMNPIVFSNGLVRRDENGKGLKLDLIRAIEWEEKLTDIGKSPALKIK